MTLEDTQPLVTWRLSTSTPRVPALGTQCRRPPRPTPSARRPRPTSPAKLGASSAPGRRTPPPARPPRQRDHPLARNSVPTNPTGCGAAPASSPPPRRPSRISAPPHPGCPHQVPSQGAAPASGRVTPSGRTTAWGRGGGAGRSTPPYPRRAELGQTRILGRPHGSGSSEIRWDPGTIAKPALSTAQPAPPPRSREWSRPRGRGRGGRGEVEEAIPGEGRMH